MKTEAHDIDKQQLAQVINAAYGLKVSTLTFLPLGEEAYAFAGYTPEGPRYFVRAQHMLRATALEETYAIIYALHTQAGLTQVVAPYPRVQGTFTIRFGSYIVAVFPFIEGHTLHDQQPSNEDVVQAATLLAAIHNSNSATSFTVRKRETFDNPFEPAIVHALKAVDELQAVNDYQQCVLDLLAAEYDDIQAALQHMRQLQIQAQLLEFDWVLTHGDPNLANLLKDCQGVIHLTDWGEISWGPPERDLSAFTGRGEQSEIFLRQYAQARGSIRLHLDLFAFYFYRWTMQEIADYTTRILFQEMGATEDEHAWAELQDYLPIRHTGIATALQELQSTLDSVLGGTKN